uniref:hypothetical protein n=1 Tax=Rhizobium sp. F40D2 TaxID=3453141 RepID=UPI003F280A1A
MRFATFCLSNKHLALCRPDIRISMAVPCRKAGYRPRANHSPRRRRQSYRAQGRATDHGVETSAPKLERIELQEERRSERPGIQRCPEIVLDLITREKSCLTNAMLKVPTRIDDVALFQSLMVRAFCKVRSARLERERINFATGIAHPRNTRRGR